MGEEGEGEGERKAGREGERCIFFWETILIFSQTVGRGECGI